MSSLTSDQSLTFKTRKLTFKRPLVQFMVQIIDFPVISDNSNPFNEICKDLFVEENTLNDNPPCNPYGYGTKLRTALTDLVDFAIEFHHLVRFHQFVLECAPHSLPVLSLPVWGVMCHFAYSNQSTNIKHKTGKETDIYKMRSP